MGSGVSAGLAAALPAMSQEELNVIMGGLPSESRLKLRVALTDIDAGQVNADALNGDDGAGNVELVVNSLAGPLCTLRFRRAWTTVGDVKQALMSEEGGALAHAQHLLFRGALLNDDTETLEKLGVWGDPVLTHITTEQGLKEKELWSLLKSGRLPRVGYTLDYTRAWVAPISHHLQTVELEVGAAVDDADNGYSDWEWGGGNSYDCRHRKVSEEKTEDFKALGLQVTAVPPLLITKVGMGRSGQSGAILAWNDQCQSAGVSEQQVRTWDTIVEANGASEPERILEGMAKPGPLTLLIAQDRCNAAVPLPTQWTPEPVVPEDCDDVMLFVHISVQRNPGQGAKFHLRWMDGAWEFLFAGQSSSGRMCKVAPYRRDRYLANSSDDAVQQPASGVAQRPGNSEEKPVVERDSDEEFEVGPTDEEISEMFLKPYRISREELNSMVDKMGIQINNLCYLKQEFDAYDEDRCGYIDIEQLKELLENLDWELSEAGFDQAACELDSDRSGEIEFFEFAEWFTSEARCVEPKIQSRS